jgi:hypothetical protein
MSERRVCKYCGMELSEDVPHGLRECHLYAVKRIAGMEWEIDQLTALCHYERQDDKSSNDTQTQTIVYGKEDSEVI